MRDRKFVIVLLFITFSLGFLYLFFRNYSDNFKQIIAKIFIESPEMRLNFIRSFDFKKAFYLLIFVLYGAIFIAYFGGKAIIKNEIQFERDRMFLEVNEILFRLKNGRKMSGKYPEIEEELGLFLSEREDAINENLKNIGEYQRSMAFFAHDLRNPLTSIKGYATLIKDTTKENSDKSVIEKYSAIILQKSDLIENYIDDILELTRFHNNMQIKKEKIELLNFFYQMREEFLPNFKKKDIELSICFNEPIEMLGDGELLSRAFQNIIKNALQYAPAKSRVLIRAKKEGNIFIEIENEAPNISDTEAMRIFEPFFRVKSTVDENSGTGLGLSIAEHIIKAHKGEVCAERQGDFLVIKIEFKEFDY